VNLFLKIYVELNIEMKLKILKEYRTLVRLGEDLMGKESRVLRLKIIMPLLILLLIMSSV
jgi:hypothetical protein